MQVIRFPGVKGRAAGAAVARGAAAVCLLSVAGCAGHLASRPGVFEASRQEVALGGRTIHPTYVRPVTPRHPGRLVVFATGDAGWWGASGKIFEHLAGLGYYVVGYDSREALKPFKQSGKKISISKSAAGLEAAFAQAKRDLGLPETAPLIAVGMSRGASLVALMAVHREMQQDLAGGIAIALTRESDYLRAPDPASSRVPVQLDSEGRIEIYPALQYLGPVPLAVIQSTHDRYVPSAESRRLLGPDTSTRRLWEVEARNHGFGGGRDALLLALDDALRWVEKTTNAAAGEATPRR